MLQNEEAKVSDILDAALTSYKGDNDSLSDNDNDETCPESQRRFCVVCRQSDNKKRMAKCRVCHYWRHTVCEDGIERQGRSDPAFSFWECREHRKDHRFTYRSKTDVEIDTHFEDTDNDMMD